MFCTSCDEYYSLLLALLFAFYYPLLIKIVYSWNLTEIYMLSSHIFMCQLREIASCSFPVENWKIGSKRMRYEQLVQDTLDLHHFTYIDFPR